jgi:hypothetical protein
MLSTLEEQYLKVVKNFSIKGHDFSEKMGDMY